MTSPQKAKGSSFEREVAKFLTETYNESFIRAPGSGAYVGGTNSARKQFLHEGQIRNFKGDIVPGQSFPHLNAECKSYADFPFHLLFTGEANLLNKWIEQCLDVADEGDFNIVFMKFNRKGTYVAVQSGPSDTKSSTTSETNSKFKLKNFFEYNSDKYGTWVIMDLQEFFTHNADEVARLCR